MEFVVYKSRSKFRVWVVKNPTTFTTSEIFFVPIIFPKFLNTAVLCCAVLCGVCASSNQMQRAQKWITPLKVAFISLSLSLSLSLSSLKPHCYELLFLNAKEKKKKEENGGKTKPSSDIVRRWVGTFHPTISYSSPLSLFQSFMWLLDPPQCPLLWFLSYSLSLSKFLYNWHFISCLLVMLSIPIR